MPGKSNKYDDIPLPFTSSAQLPRRQPTQSRSGPSSGPSSGPRSGVGGTVKRSKTLTRPDRHVAPAPLIAPPAHHFSDQPSPTGGAGGDPRGVRDWWVIWSYATTFWAPPALLAWFGIKEKQSRQAWREKITLCWIAIMLGAVVGFATMGLQRALCPGGEDDAVFDRLGSQDLTVSISGWTFNVSTSLTQADADFYALSKRMPGIDVTTLFTRQASDYPSCSSESRYASTPYCSGGTRAGTSGAMAGVYACPLPALTNSTFTSLRIQNTTGQSGYSWDQVAALENFMVIDGNVLNLIPYMSANPNPIAGDEVDAAIRQVLLNQSDYGKDATRLFHNHKVTHDAIPCLTSRYLAGKIDRITPGCFVAALFLYTSLAVILGVVLIRFAMACIFNWFLSARLVQTPNRRDLARDAISPAVMPEGANMSVHNKTGTAPWSAGVGAVTWGKRPPSGKKLGGGGVDRSLTPSPNGLAPNVPSKGVQIQEPIISLTQIGSELFTVCLVTCYSEGEDSVRGTVESIASTNYSDRRKLIWIVCDGMITGAGEKLSTPDICVSMLDADPRFGNPMPMGYIAVGSGAKRENRAMVYAGHTVTKNGHRTPTIIVVKCGMPSEARDKKPGNRGKRDSQLILMNFFSRVTYNDRMSPLDFDIFRKVHVLMGVTPDFFEVVLMVDADTKIFPDSLRYLVNSMQADNMVMGVCGETRIANKRQSWVTAIQVYEYFISHHLAKGFESVFGGVTCLPGCFSMYRIKARKDYDNDWVPILVKPEIVREYSQSEVHTLHQKNLLLLGEDRFLSTILLRTFPHRKNIFVPQARCRTVAPDTFSVLLSQRRRWINSTVHNLMELVRVRNLCGTFCFSMQFVVFMDLIGTVVLPVSICLTGALIINSIITPPRSFQEAIPLMLLAAVLGLPAILILITTRKMIYVAWMMCYLLALPIWNFVLPVYAFWHFDDFSWGETRRVEGELKSTAHDDKTAVFDGTTIPLRRWEDWEKSRLRKVRREEKRRRDMERQFGAGFYDDTHAGAGSQDSHAYATAAANGLPPPTRGLHPFFGRSGSGSGEGDSDAGSVFSSDEDVWGAEIGGYNENNPSFPPPPIAMPAADHLHPTHVLDHNAPGHANNSGKTLGMDEMAAMLDQEWDEPAPPARAASPLPPLQPGRANAYAAGGGSGPGSATSPLQGRHAETVPLNRWDPSMGNGNGAGSGFGNASGYVNGNGNGSGNGHGYASAPNTGSSRSRVPPQMQAQIAPRSAGVNGYGASASGVERAHGSGHAKKRSGGRAKGSDEYEYQDAREGGYGPMGPLSDWEPRSGSGSGAGGPAAGASGKGKRI